MVARLSAQEASSVRWANDAAHLATHESELQLLLDESRGLARIVGSLTMRRSDGRAVGFEVEVRYPGLDPFQVPDVYDPVGRFPPNPERHVERDGRFCLWLPPKAPRPRFRQPDGLPFFLDRVREFLRLQVIYETRVRRGKVPHWPGPEWGHGEDGYDEWARENFADLDADQIRTLLRLVGEPPRRAGARCACGSGRRFGNCHKGVVRELRAAWDDRDARSACLRFLKERERNA